MMHAAPAAGLAALLLVLVAVPASAQETTLEKRSNDSSVSGAIIMKDRESATGSVDRDCVGTKPQAEDKGPVDSAARAQNKSAPEPICN